MSLYASALGSAERNRPGSLSIRELLILRMLFEEGRLASPQICARMPFFKSDGAFTGAMRRLRREGLVGDGRIAVAKSRTSFGSILGEWSSLGKAFNSFGNLSKSPLTNPPRSRQRLTPTSD